MNLLVDELPESVTVDGREFAINSDFRACLKTILAFEDPELTAGEKQAILLRNFYAKVVPENLQDAYDVAIWFLDGGEDDQGRKQDEVQDSPRLYSFSGDASLIYAAMRQTHGIDLSHTELHWWQFLALFSDLGQDTAFCNLVSLRKRVKNGTASKEERKAAREMGSAFEVPEIDDRTLEEKEAENEFFRLLDKGERNEQI